MSLFISKFVRNKYNTYNGRCGEVGWKKLLHDYLFVIDPCIVGNAPHVKYDRYHTMSDSKMGKHTGPFVYPGKNNVLCSLSKRSIYSTCMIVGTIVFMNHMSGLGYVVHGNVDDSKYVEFINRLHDKCTIYISPKPTIRLRCHIRTKTNYFGVAI